MQTPEQPLPSAPLRRHEIARIEVGTTAVSAMTARMLTVGFLLSLAVVPALEWTGLRPLIREQVERFAAGQPVPGASPWTRVVSVNRRVLAGLTGFERALEQESRLGRWLRPPAQLLLTGWLGAGNERVYPGRDGWLFYRPDVEYVTGPSLVHPAELRRRVSAAPEWEVSPQPDPRPALVRFAHDLEARGVALVVVPVPLKPGVHPARLSRRYEDATAVLQNPGYGELIEDLRRAGVQVFDVAEALGRRGTAPLYLETDSHWRPEVMEQIAQRLARSVEARASLPAAPEADYLVERVEVRNAGDTVRMLDLPEGSGRFAPEAVWLQRILRPDGSLWRSSPDADVLLLGDSFSNIYSLESMGWGTSAGFAEQLSHALRRPVDRIIQNDEGAFATRAILQQNPARLDGKRVVIYQFAARELAFGDWKVLPMQ